MHRRLQYIESYNQKVTELFKEAQVTRSGLFDLRNVGKKIGLKKDEIEAMYYHLKKSNMIENASGSLLRISKYGKMLQNGEINYGYAPM